MAISLTVPYQMVRVVIQLLDQNVHHVSSSLFVFRLPQVEDFTETNCVDVLLKNKSTDLIRHMDWRIPFLFGFRVPADVVECQPE